MGKQDSDGPWTKDCQHKRREAQTERAAVKKSPVIATMAISERHHGPKEEKEYEEEVN